MSRLLEVVIFIATTLVVDFLRNWIKVIQICGQQAVVLPQMCLLSNTNVPAAEWMKGDQNTLAVLRVIPSMKSGVKLFSTASDFAAAVVPQGSVRQVRIIYTNPRHMLGGCLGGWYSHRLFMAAQDIGRILERLRISQKRYIAGDDTYQV